MAGAETTGAALEISKIDLAYRGRGDAAIPLVHEASLRVGSGKIHALVGESGSGKTLLARSIVRLLPPGIRIGGGAIRFGGRDLTACTDKDMLAIRGKEIGFVFQEPMLSLNPAIRIGEQMAEGLRRHLGLPKDEIRARSIEMLERVSMSSPEQALDRFPHEFSGGMRQRIMLASVLALRPSLLLADEPTTALDAVIQRDVLDIMTELTRDLGTSVLLITHDLGLVAQYAEEVTVMEKGRVVETGLADDVIGCPRQDYTRKLLMACPTRKPRAPVADDAKIVLNVEDLTMRYADAPAWPWQRRVEVEAVKRLSLSLKAGQTLAIVGESGSGKTTVGRAVMGLRAASDGLVEIGGTELVASDRRLLRRLRRQAQIVFQDPASSLDPRYRVGALVEEGLTLAGTLSAAERRHKAVVALADVGLAEAYLERFPHELSGGQRQRVAIARAIILDPKIIVADEAVSALDVTVQAQVLDLLDRLQKEKGFAYLFISHDLGVVEQISDRIVVMRKGRVVEAASRERLFDGPIHPYTRQLLTASVEVRETGEGRFAVKRREPPPAAARAGVSFYDGVGPYCLRELDPGHLVAVADQPSTSERFGEPV